MSQPSIAEVNFADDVTEDEQYLNDLYEITSTAELSFDEKVELLLELGREYFDVGVGMLTHERKDSFEIEHMVGSHPELGEGTLTPPMTDNYCRRVVSTGETICVRDADEAGWNDDALYHRFELECYAGVEVTAGDDRYGTVCFTDLDPRAESFTQTEQAFLELLGQCVSYELERKQRVDHLTALNALTRELMDVETADAVGQRVVEAAETTLGLPVTALVLYDDQRGTFDVVAQTDTAAELLDATSLLNPDEGAGWDAFVEGRPRRTAVLPDASDLDVHPPVTEMAAFPLGDHGVFLTGSTATEGFNPTDFDFAETVAANAEAALDRAARERKLARQNDRLESFASMLAHELRNPLAIAQIYHQEAADGDDAAADEVTTALDRIEEMIDVLLVTARRTDSVIDWQPVSLADAAEEGWADLSSQAGDLVVETDVTVRADPIHLRHLLENLYGNAIDHGGEDVTIRVGDLPDGFYVADDGPGIPAEERDDVFEAGYTTDEAGIGLGLTFVAQLAETYGWDYALTESEEGGTRVEFTGAELVREA